MQPEDRKRFVCAVSFLLSAKVEFDIELLVETLELISHFVAHATDIAVFSVIQKTIVENE